MLLYTFSLSLSDSPLLTNQKARPLRWGWKDGFYTVFCTFSCGVTHPGFDFSNILLTQGKKMWHIEAPWPSGCGPCCDMKSVLTRDPGPSPPSLPEGSVCAGTTPSSATAPSGEGPGGGGTMECQKGKLSLSAPGLALDMTGAGDPRPCGAKLCPVSLIHSLIHCCMFLSTRPPSASREEAGSWPWGLL